MNWETQQVYGWLLEWPDLSKIIGRARRKARRVCDTAQGIEANTQTNILFWLWGNGERTVRAVALEHMTHIRFTDSDTDDALNIQRNQVGWNRIAKVLATY